MRKPSPDRIVQVVLVVALGVFLYLAPNLFEAFRLRQLTQALVFAVAVLGLNVVMGYTGQISLGHSAFFGLGAYTSAVLVSELEWSLFATMPVAALLAFVVGCLVGLPALRISGHYLALVTLIVAVAFPTIVKRFDGITGGSNGLRVDVDLVPPAWTGLSARQPGIYVYFLVLAISVVILLAVVGLVRSRVGRAMKALRDNPTGAMAAGVNVAYYKTMAFGVSGLIAGLAGSLFVMATPFVSPTSFELLTAINLLIALAVGGMGSYFGPLCGGLYLVFVPYATAEIGEGSFSTVLSGALLLLVVLVMPRGIAGVGRSVLAALAGRGGGVETDDPDDTGPAESSTALSATN